VGSGSGRAGGRRIIPQCLFRCLFLLFFGVVFWSVVSDILAEMGAIWVPFGGLFDDFIEFWAICWIALTLEPKAIFSGFGGPRSSLIRLLFQVRIQGVFLAVFMWFSVILGVIWGPFWLPLALPFSGNSRVRSG
jgi:hypothetical protein